MPCENSATKSRTRFMICVARVGNRRVERRLGKAKFCCYPARQKWALIFCFGQRPNPQASALWPWSRRLSDRRSHQNKHSLAATGFLLSYYGWVLPLYHHNSETRGSEGLVSHSVCLAALLFPVQGTFSLKQVSR